MATILAHRQVFLLGYVTVNQGILPLTPDLTSQPPFDLDKSMITKDFKKLLSSLCGFGHGRATSQ